MKKISTWMGRPIEELPREELLTVIEHLGDQLGRMTEELARMRPHVDWVGFLVSKPGEKQ